MRRIGTTERRARLVLRHRLNPWARAQSPADVAASVVALHSTDPASVFLSTLSRMRAGQVRDVEAALYDDRVLVRMLGMRRTVFVVRRELAPVVQAAATRAVAVQQRRLLHRLLEEAGVTDAAEAWLEDLERSALRALERRGEASAAELSADEPQLRTPILLAEGKSYAAWQNISTRVLFLLAADGRIVRGRPRGSWISSQYRWALTPFWLGRTIDDWPTERAQAELARRWLAAYGPGTVADLRWWTGWTVGETKRALAANSVAEVDMEEATGVVLRDDLEPAPAVEPWVALLPALDPTPMGWSTREWFLGDHGAALFDRSGNVGPTVWWDGRVVGGWAQRKGGEIVLRLLEDVGADATAAVDVEVERLTALIGAARVTPRFRTPLERELSA